jgi:HD-like signal output (HDOD) protein
VQFSKSTEINGMPVKQGTNEKLLKLLSVGVELPRLPGAGIELLSIMHMPMAQIEVRQVAALVESDPTLTAAVLRMANSAYYGGMREVTMIHQAITRMGLEDSMHVLSYHYLRGVMGAVKNLPHFCSKLFWLHSWAAATAARMLGQPQYLVRSLPAELYTAGLLHDIGKIVMASHLGEAFDQACAKANEQGVPIGQAEMEVIGVDHGVLGGYLLDSWNLPASILAAVGSHHDPASVQPPAREIALLVELADAIAHQCGFGDGTGQPVPDPMQTAIAYDTISPLAAPARREQAIGEIQFKLREKAQMFQRRSRPPQEEEKPMRTQARREADAAAVHDEKLEPVELRPERSHAPVPLKQRGRHRGFWARMIGWTRALLNG